MTIASAPSEPTITHRRRTAINTTTTATMTRTIPTEANQWMCAFFGGAVGSAMMSPAKRSKAGCPCDGVPQYPKAPTIRATAENRSSDDVPALAPLLLDPFLLEALPLKSLFLEPLPLQSLLFDPLLFDPLLFDPLLLEPLLLEPLLLEPLPTFALARSLVGHDGLLFGPQLFGGFPSFDLGLLRGARRAVRRATACRGPECPTRRCSPRDGSISETPPRPHRPGSCWRALHRRTG